MKTILSTLAVAWAVVGVGTQAVRAEPPRPSTRPAPPQPRPPAAEAAKPADPPGLIRLDPRYPAWIDPAKKRIVMIGQVCLRQGQLEMFACPRNTKEHESILSVPVEALDVHTALIALGAEPGSPARFINENGEADYRPAHGTEIDVSVFWTDEQGQRRRAAAQDWVRNAESGRALQHPWVFGGSAFWQDPVTGVKHYQAEVGDFICVSNFPTAMLDLPIESSDKDSLRAFEAFTERIPPQGTKVTIVLTPKLKPAENNRIRKMQNEK